MIHALLEIREASILNDTTATAAEPPPPAWRRVPASLLRLRWLLPLLAVATVAINWPALRLGFIFDDHVQLLQFRDAGPLDTSMNLFAFLPDEAAVRQWRATGGLPWWTSDHLQLSFWRPLSSFTHWIDYRLWADSPAMHHAHSILWAVLMVWMAALLHRRFFGACGAALLAIWFHTFDDAHHTPIAWIANRNAVIASFFALASLWAHDRWRTDGAPRLRWFSIGLFAFALLSGEFGVGAGGLLLSYALFLDPAPAPKTRLLAIMPHVAVGAVWFLFYSLSGHGATGSSIYVDPARDPLRFLSSMAVSLPLLMETQWGPLASDLRGILSAPAQRTLLVFSIAWTSLLLLLAAPLLRQSRVARFYLGAAVLPLLPVAATAPSDRLVLLSSFGGFGLLSALLTGIWTEKSWLPRRARWLYLGAGVLLLVVHGFVSPLSYRSRIRQLAALNEFVTTSGNSLPAGTDPARQTLVAVTMPGPFFFAMARMSGTTGEKRLPANALGIASAHTAVAVERIDATSIRVVPEGGFLQPHGHWPPDPERPPPFHPAYIVQFFETLYRDPSTAPFRAGETVDISPGLAVTIERIDESGRPASILVRFPVPLEDPSLLWVSFAGRDYESWQPPTPGESKTIPAVDMRLFR